jgi:hypothetical protein
MALLLKAAALAAVLVSAPAITEGLPPTPDRLHELVPAVEPTQPDVVFQNYPLVKRIDCREGRGTGFRVGAHHMLSVAHVTTLNSCGIGGLPISVTEQDRAHDFSRFDVARATSNGFSVDCSGFRPGHWYWAIGHAQGAAFQTAVAIYATIYTDDAGKRIFVGHHTVIPGMSGGPVIDPETNKVVGTVNAYDPQDGLSISQELRNTSICGAHIA